METRARKQLPEKANYLFYRNELRSVPDDALIEEILSDWYFDYKKLESRHGFIQWIFPELNRQGSNPYSVALTKEEAKLIREDLECAKRVVRAYRMMLNFYGIVLVNELTGELARNEEIYKDRFDNLLKHSHNENRIRRIIRSLGQMGFARYRKPLVDFFADQLLNKGELNRCHYSYEHDWKKALEVESKEYILDTTETAEDRNDSIFFAKESNENQ